MNKIILIPLFLALFIISCSPFSLAAGEELSVVGLNTVWTLIAAFLVFFMQAGFAMVEAGFTQAKNSGNIIMKNLMDFSAGSLVYWALGFAFMFGTGNQLIGTSGFLLNGSFQHLSLDIPLAAFVIFQTVFAATAATIVSGAMAGRTKFSGYLIYSIVITGFIYPVVGHWIWGGGWLTEMVDFAGSTVVHSVGGWAALAGAMVLGPRIGKYNEDGTSNQIRGHNLLIAALGVFILWFGWFGFNAGSTVSGTDLNIANIAVNTNLAAAAGATFAMLTSFFKYGIADVELTLNGALAGLVGITAGVAAVSNLGAIIIGGISSIVMVYAIDFIEWIKVDDPVGAISVHGVCGSLGTLLVGVFSVESGILYGNSWGLLIVQFKGVISVAVWTFSIAYILFKIIDLTIGLRVSELEEKHGLDKSEHGSQTYDLNSMSWEQVEKILTGLNRMAEGDFSTRLEVEAGAENEVLTAFNQTNEQISQLINELSEIIIDLSDYSSQLFSSAQEGEAVSETVFTNIEQMSTSINNIAAINHQADDLSTSADLQTTDGVESLENVIKQMEEINTSISSSVNSIEYLNDKSEEIEEIVQFITDITEQINLLSLNASIEAARAGEAGQGFSVVAEEIKELADRTENATGKITNLLRETQRESKSSLEEITTAQTQAQEGKQLVKKATQSFSEIDNLVAEVSDNLSATAEDNKRLEQKSNNIEEEAKEIKNMSQQYISLSEKMNDMVNELERINMKFDCC